MTELRFVKYTEEYKIKLRGIWYSAERPDGSKFRKLLLKENAVDEYGRIPHRNVLNEWRRDMMWDFWADALDTRVMTIEENDLVTKKADMLKRHADLGWELQLNGMKYLKESGFDTSASAVAAIIKGAELERESRGVGEMMIKMAKMTDTDLVQEILKLSARASENNQIIDSDEVLPVEDGDDTASTT